MIEWLSQYSGYVTLLAFFSAFCGIALWIYLPKNKETLEKHTEIPLRESPDV